MLTLRAVLLRTIEQNIQPTRNLLSQVKITRITDEIENRYSRAELSPEPADLQQIKSDFLKAEKNNSWEIINERSWKKACWVLWGSNEPIAASKIFLKKYLEFCNTHASPRIIKSLIHVYLRDFKSGMPGQSDIAHFIREKLAIDRFKKLLPLWVERDKHHHLFDPKKEFSSNARNFVQSSQNAKDHLINLGLEGQLESANFSQEIFEAVTRDVEINIAKSSSALDLFNRVKDLSLVNNKELRYPQKKYILIESLLRPWREKTPPPELCRKILEFLLKHFHDPRRIEGRINWVGISEESLRVIRKWLAGETLEQFFEIIKKTANDEHWSYRHKFWKAYFDDGYIDDAWVALGRDSRTEAKFHSIQGNELIAANVRGSGVKSDHSVLIFKVGDLTICEWSHDGKCRIWLEANKNSPRLYENNYEADHLRTKSQKIVRGHKEDGISHINSKGYWWQKKLAEFIENYTGIKMPSRKYEIK
jgi:hypothetical protein